MIEAANQIEQHQANTRQPPGQVARMPTFAEASPNASYRASAEHDNESLHPISRDSMPNTESELAATMQQLKAENQHQRKVIEELHNVIKQRDAEI